MRTKLLAACLLCLAVFVVAPLAGAADVVAVTALDAAVALAEAPAAEPGPASDLAADTLFCSTQPQAASSYWGPWCGEPCYDPGAEDFCTGYHCNGSLHIGACFCANSRWSCDWQQCPGW